MALDIRAMEMPDGLLKQAKPGGPRKRDDMYWNWKTGGIALGVIFFAALALVKPIGVSTQFVILDGILAKTVNPSLIREDETAKHGYASPNAYLNKSGGKYAAKIANPANYGFVFVVSMIFGGLAGRVLQRRRTDALPPSLPACHTRRFGNRPLLRYFLVFAGGFLVLWGARLAGGCTSGHMMSGIMQTSLSGYAFTLAVFATAVPTALLLYRKGGRS